jgi:hypothetical protein
MDKKKGYVLLLINAGVRSSVSERQKSRWLLHYEAVQRRAARYVVSNQRNRSSVSNMLQRLKWRPLANRRKDARLMMMYKIDRELVSITKENRLIPPCRRSRNR